MRDLEVAKTTLPISIWGVPVQKWAGILGYLHTGNPRFQIEFVSIWGLTYMPRALALRISSSTYVVVAAVINSSCACAQWLMDSSCACTWWLIDHIVMCCHRRTTIQSVKWSSCTCAWVAWCRHMMLPQPNGYLCCHRGMQYDNMVCLYTISRYSLSFLCDTDMKRKEGGRWQHMLLLHPRCYRRRCYTTLIVIKTFEQIGSLSFYRHRIQLIVICHYDDSQYMKHLCACTWVASCWHMLLSQHYCRCHLWATRYIIATMRLAQLL
jgi:hypothetical protein